MLAAPVLASPDRQLGRYLEPALWVLIALDGGPLGLSGLLDAVRSLDGPMGHGTLLGAVSRLERLGLADSMVTDGESRVYRLTILGRAGADAAAVLRGRSPMSTLIRLYPAAWRARYGAEFEDLLAERPPTGRDLLDIVVAAIDAHETDGWWFWPRCPCRS